MSLLCVCTYVWVGGAWSNAARIAAGRATPPPTSQPFNPNLQRQWRRWSRAGTLLLALPLSPPTPLPTLPPTITLQWRRWSWIWSPSASTRSSASCPPRSCPRRPVGCLLGGARCPPTSHRQRSGSLPTQAPQAGAPSGVQAGWPQAQSRPLPDLRTLRCPCCGSYRALCPSARAPALLHPCSLSMFAGQTRTCSQPTLTQAVQFTSGTICMRRVQSGQDSGAMSKGTRNERRDWR